MERIHNGLERDGYVNAAFMEKITTKEVSLCLKNGVLAGFVCSSNKVDKCNKLFFFTFSPPAL